MNGATHKIGGIAAGLTAASLMYGAGTIIAITNQNNEIEPIIHLTGASMFCLIGGIIGSISPDLDKERTTASNKFPIVSFVIRLFTSHREFLHTLIGSTFLNYVALWFSMVVIKFFNEKSMNPTTQISIILSNIWLCIKKFLMLIGNGLDPIDCMRPLFLGILFGIYSHLILDMITPDGAPLFWPIYKKNISIAKLNGKKHGPIVSLSIIALTFVLLYFKIL